MPTSYDQPVYFIGITLPAELYTVISEHKWDIHTQDKSTLKPLLPHITLLNPPSVSGILPEELLPRVKRVAEQHLPLTLSLEEVGFFKTNVCYIRIQSHGLYSLQSQLVNLLPVEAQSLHYKRPYTPHVTLAQAYEPHQLDITSLGQYVSDHIALPQQFTVDSLSYFQRIVPREYRAKAV